jgi:hypothetical protein
MNGQVIPKAQSSSGIDIFDPELAFQRKFSSYGTWRLEVLLNRATAS